MSDPTNSSPTQSPATANSNNDAAETIKDRLANTRTTLLSSDSIGTYLGVPDAPTGLQWVHVGKSDILVTEQSATSYFKAQQAFQADSDAPLPAHPQSAILSAVVHISSDDYYLTSDGRWTGPTDTTKTFADVKPSCTGEAPIHKPFSSDFKNVLKHLRTILDMGRTKGFNNSKGVFFNKDGGKPKIKFRHVLFEAVPASNEGGNSSSVTLSSDSDSENLPEHYTIANWHVHSDEAREALDTMQHTHRVRHLEAYDVDADVILPSDYRQHLQDAVVQIHFTLQHWSISGRSRTSCDTYVADIVHMRVIVPPLPSAPETPTKRKFHLTDPLAPNTSPKKLKRSSTST